MDHRLHYFVSKDFRKGIDAYLHYFVSIPPTLAAAKNI